MTDIEFWPLLSCDLDNGKIYAMGHKSNAEFMETFHISVNNELIEMVVISIESGGRWHARDAASYLEEVSDGQR